MSLNVEHLRRTADTLEQAIAMLAQTRADETLKILPGYLDDVRALAVPLQALFDAQA